MNEITIRLSDSDLTKLKAKLVYSGNVDNVCIKVTEAVLNESPIVIEYLKGELL